jgi:hypothetical protein
VVLLEIRSAIASESAKESVIGIGTVKEIAETATKRTVNVKKTAIDTSAMKGREAEVGAGLRKSRVALRVETTKGLLHHPPMTGVMEESIAGMTVAIETTSITIQIHKTEIIKMEPPNLHLILIVLVIIGMIKLRLQ